ncbi:hypothetical protein STEG23_001277 [Scotinomys teguina]
MRLVCSFCRANGVQRKLGIQSLSRTKGPWILETQGISHSTPFKKVIRTVPPLTSNTLYSPRFKRSELGRNKRTVDSRNTRDISFDSIQEGDKNSTSSYIQHTLLAGKT